LFKRNRNHAPPPRISSITGDGITAVAHKESAPADSKRRSPSESAFSRAGISLARWLARNVAHASLQEQTCAGFGTRGNLTDRGCPALAKHRCPLRLHNHHATQHAGSNNRIVDFNQATFPLAGKPVGDAFTGATDCTLVKGLGNLRKSF